LIAINLMTGMKMKYKILTAALLSLLLGGCSSGHFVGFTQCAKDGSAVWWAYPNSHGSMDGLDVNAATCGR
jgi:hypothetical protein